MMRGDLPVKCYDMKLNKSMAQDYRTLLQASSGIRCKFTMLTQPSPGQSLHPAIGFTSFKLCQHVLLKCASYAGCEFSIPQLELKQVLGYCSESQASSSVWICYTSPIIAAALPSNGPITADNILFLIDNHHESDMFAQSTCRHPIPSFYLPTVCSTKG